MFRKRGISSRCLQSSRHQARETEPYECTSVTCQLVTLSTNPFQTAEREQALDSKMGNIPHSFFCPYIRVLIE